MCHLFGLLLQVAGRSARRDPGNVQFGVALAVALDPFVVLAPLELDHFDLVAPPLGFDGRGVFGRGFRPKYDRRWREDSPNRPL